MPLSIGSFSAALATLIAPLPTLLFNECVVKIEKIEEAERMKEEDLVAGTIRSDFSPGYRGNSRCLDQ